MNEIEKLQYILAELLEEHDLRPDQIKKLSFEEFEVLNENFKKKTGNSLDQLFKLIKAKEATNDGVIFDEQMSRCWAEKYAQCHTIFHAINIKHELHDFYSALLHKSAVGRGIPSPRCIYAAATVRGVPSAVN